MPRGKVEFNSFNRGELSPLLNGREKLEVYYKTAKQITNAVCLVEGGLKRRFGLLYLDSLRNDITEYSSGSITVTDPGSSGGTTGNLVDGDWGTYMTNTVGIGTTDDFISWQIDLGSLQDVAFIDVEKVSITGSVSTTEFEIEKSDNGSTWTTLYTGTKPNQYTMKLDQTERYYRFAVDDNTRYFRLIRNGTENLGSENVKTAEVRVWTDSGSIDLSASGAAFALESFEFRDDQNYELLFTDKNMAVYKDDELQANVRSPYTLSQLAIINYDQDHDTAVFVHEDVPPYELVRQGENYLWRFSNLMDEDETPINIENLPRHEFEVNDENPSIVLQVGARSGQITLTAETGTPFTNAKVGQRINVASGGNKGIARIIRQDATNPDTVVHCQTIVPFYDTSDVASGDWTYEKGWEAIFSSDRGYPRAVSYYKDRLVFGGPKQAPNSLIASIIGDYYNFDEGTLNDHNGFHLPLKSRNADVIYHLNSHENLEIFTNSGEYVIKSSDDFTPTGKVKFSLQSTQGISPKVRPEDLQDGGTLFVQKGGQNIKEFIFADDVLSYKNNTISAFSSHLVNQPVDGSIRNETTTDNFTIYTFVNTDGSLIFATLLKEQEVIGFAEQTTDGSFENVIGVGNDIYAVVKRTINGSDKYYFEKFTFDRFTDSATYLQVGNSNIDGTEYTGAITLTDPDNNNTNSGTELAYLDNDSTSDGNYYTTTTSISTTDDYVVFKYDLNSNEDVDYIRLSKISLTSGSTDEFQIEYSTDDFASDIHAASKTISLSTTELESIDIPIGSSTRYIRLIRNGTTDLGSAKIKLIEADVHLNKSVTVSGLDYLEGKDVWTIIDGSVYGQETVSSGQITLDKNVFVDVEIGLDYNPTIVTNPLEDPQNLGPLKGNKKCITEILVNVNDTQQILVNGKDPIPELLSPASSTIDNTPISYTDRYTIFGSQGWDELGEVTITQDKPLKMTLLNISMIFNYGK